MFDADVMVFIVTLICYHTRINEETHTAHTWNHKLTHTYKYILTPLAIC